MDDTTGSPSGEEETPADKAPPQRNIEAPVVVIACPLPDGETESDFQLRARYINGVEHIARAWDAVSPTVWDGDRAWLSFAQGPHEKRTSQAYRAAQDLLVRGALALELPVRVAVAITTVAPDGLPLIEGPPAELLLSMLARVPEKRLIATEDFVLSLPAEHRFEFAPAPAADAETRFYVASPGGVQKKSDPLDPRVLWGAFEEYALSPEVREVRYVGFRLPKRAPPVLDLLDVFVPPNTTWTQRRWEDAARAESAGDDQDAAEIDRSFPLREDYGSPVVHDLQRHKHLVFLGEPGAGKTTLLKWLALVAANGQWPAITEEARPCLPLLISVGRLAEVLRGFWNSGVEALTSYYVPAEAPGADAIAGFLDTQLRLGRCLVLFDGLDEVRTDDRVRTEEWLQAFAERYSKNRFVTTSRFVGYSGLRLPEDAEVRRLTALDSEGRSAFVHAFCRAYLKWETGRDRPADAGLQATALLESIAANDRLSSLARTPFMLSALALIHRAEGRLPRHRVQAYQMFLRALCETWGDARRLVPEASVSDERKVVLYEEEAIPVLGDLALALHERYPRGVAPTDVVRRTIATSLQEREEIDEEAALGLADAFLKRAGQEVQILLERGAGQWGFLHLTFQEMFVAAGLHSTERFEEVALAHLLSPRWEEVIRLGVGYLALVQTRPVAAKRFVERVLAYKAPEPWTRAEETLGKHIGIAALLAMEAGEALPPAFQRRVAEEFARWYCEGLPRLMGEFVAEPGPQQRLDTWLRQLGLSDFAKPVTEAILKYLSTDDGQTRATAARALDKLGAEVPLDSVARTMERDDVKRPRQYANLVTRSATLEPANPDPSVRAHVANRLALAGEGQSALLVQLLRDPAANVRASALSFLLNQQLNRKNPPVPVEEVAALLAEEGCARDAAWVLSKAGEAGARALVEHADKPVARAGLWLWAERRQWSFGSATEQGETA